VLETKAPHNTLATAQPLPDLPFFGVVGTISFSDTIDVYRLTLSEKAEAIDFGLAFQNHGTTVPIEFQIFNSSGQSLAEWSSSGQGVSILLAQLGPQAAGSTLYLGISAGSSLGSAASSAGLTYQLWVSRESATDSSTGSPLNSSTVPTLALSPLSAAVLTPLAALAAAPAGREPDANPAVPVTSTGGLTVAMTVGTPAMRTGRPSVEALSVGNSDRATERDLDAFAHENLSDQQLASNANDQPKASDPGSGPDAGQFVAMNGPGGFALLGGMAMGHRRRYAAASALGADLAASATPIETSRGIDSEGITASGTAVVTDEQDQIADGSVRTRLWDRLPKTLVSGLGLAIVFTVNAALSQPFAGFDYLASWFENHVNQVRRTSASQGARRAGRALRQ